MVEHPEFSAPPLPLQECPALAVFLKRKSDSEYHLAGHR
jgi:hypothetical protein